jgi:acyl-CoA thioester hydrolase
MENIFETKVYYSDTDAYGVVWHGNYLRWLEKGRVDFCSQLGFDLVELQKENIVLPVAEIDIKYKASAKLNNNLTIKTILSEIKPLYVIFTQTIYDNEKTYISANVKVVAVNNDGKLYRKIPQKLYEAFLPLVEDKNEIK